VSADAAKARCRCVGGFGASGGAYVGKSLGGFGGEGNESDCGGEAEATVPGRRKEVTIPLRNYQDFGQNEIAGEKLVMSDPHAVDKGLGRRSEGRMPFKVVDPEHGIEIELHSPSLRVPSGGFQRLRLLPAAVETIEQSPAFLIGEGLFVEFGCDWRDGVGGHGRSLCC
jgi:hypothetical protein